MTTLGKVAAVATIIAAVFTVAAYFNPKPSNSPEWKELVSQLPEKREIPLGDIKPKENKRLSAEIRSVVIESPEELKQLHEIAKKISYSPTMNKELNKLVDIAIEKNHIEYAILIANDVSYSPTKNSALTKIVEKLLAQNKIQAAVKAAELISYSPTRNSMLQKILAAKQNNASNRPPQPTPKSGAAEL